MHCTACTHATRGMRASVKGRTAWHGVGEETAGHEEILPSLAVAGRGSRFQEISRPDAEGRPPFAGHFAGDDAEWRAEGKLKQAGREREEKWVW